LKLARILTALFAAVLLLAGCAGSPDDTAGSGDTLLESYGLTGMDAEQVINQLDRSTEPRPTKLGGSVRPTELLLSDGTDEQVLPMPDDKFYLSIAPFVDSTHDCFFHSLGTCQGELVEEPVHVNITTDDGQVLVDQDATTWTNGFAGFWVPKGTSGTITISQDGRQGSVGFATGDQDATCITTLRLV